MIRQNPHGRREPYTASGIRRVKCAHPRCRQASRHQWSSCALKGRYLAVCIEHDVAINRWLLEEFKIPRANALLREYAQSQAAPLGRGATGQGRTEGR